VTGKFDAPSPHCAELKKVYTRMLWLLAQGDERLLATAQFPGGKNRADHFLG
jgi:hypothetical protein